MRSTPTPYRSFIYDTKPRPRVCIQTLSLLTKHMKPPNLELCTTKSPGHPLSTPSIHVQMPYPTNSRLSLNWRVRIGSRQPKPQNSAVPPPIGRLDQNGPDTKTRAFPLTTFFHERGAPLSAILDPTLIKRVLWTTAWRRVKGT